MKPGDVVLLPLTEAVGGSMKWRPALILCLLPGPYQTLLVCGFSTQIHTVLPNWDELIQPGDTDFASSGLHQASVIRLSYLRAALPTEVKKLVGRIDSARLTRLRARLAAQVRP